LNPSGRYSRGKSAHTALSQFHHFRQLLGPRLIKTRCMNKRRHHEVTGRVREQVQNDKIERAAIENEAARILGWVFSDAEDARGGCLAD
jgi:hypothetical protein